MYQRGSHWTDLHQFDVGTFMKIQIWLKSRKNIGDFTRRSEYALFLLATLNRHKALTSIELVSGC